MYLSIHPSIYLYAQNPKPYTLNPMAGFTGEPRKPGPVLAAVSKAPLLVRPRRLGNGGMVELAL